MAKPATKPEEGKKPVMGRPTKFEPRFVEEARKLCMLGATDQELADFFDVEVRTIHRWKGDHEDFCHALKAGKEAADERVERSLYQKAIGYEQDEVKIFMPGGKDEPVYAPYRAKIAPDTTAAIFWLKNRRSEAWREKVHTELTGKDGGPVEFSTMTPEQLEQKIRELSAKVGLGDPS